LVYWETTKRCNLRCVHCRAIPQGRASPDELSTTEGFRLIDDIRACGTPVLVLTGGEPLLRGDLFVLARYAARRGLPAALATNGTLVTRETARLIANVPFKRISISLDGPDSATHDQFRRVPGAFDLAVDGFIHLKELGMSMQVNTTVTARNRARLEAIHELVRKLGADAWHLFLLVPVGCGLDIAPDAQLAPRDYEAVLHWIDDLTQSEPMEIRATCAPHAQRIRLQRQTLMEEAVPIPAARLGCLAGTGICFISHRGDVYPCGYLPVSAGNVRNTPFFRIWETAPIFEELREPARLMGKCGACEYRGVCGGCRARAFGKTGHYLSEEPFCNYIPAKASC
jgi:radical SAM protein with 4Fe4S-binding SPASM domain